MATGVVFSDDAIHGEVCDSGCMDTHTKLLRRLKRNGFVVEYLRNGHTKIRRPNGSYLMTMSTSPGDTNATKAAERLLRRLGVTLEDG
jgi:hypothetical protein